MVAVLVVLIVLHVLGPLRVVEGWFVQLTAPIVQTAVRGGSAIFHVGDFFESQKSLRLKNSELQAENEKLQSENTRLAEVDHENEALRKQLGFRERSKFTLAPAFVIGYDPNSFNEFMTIDKGSNDGIAVNDPVVADSGALIGRINSVTARSAQVMLIIDPNSVIDSEIQESRAAGLVTGDHGLGLIMSKILQEQAVVTGDKVITTGLGGIFPKGLLVGEVKDVHTSQNQLFQEARVMPVVTFRDLEIVFVITEF